MTPPTVIITNDHTTPTKTLIERYARRMTIEQRLAEIIRAFHLDALSSTVNLNVDLDVVLCVLAQALTAAFRTRLGGGYATVTPDVLQRRFFQTPGEITNRDDITTIRIDRRTYSPVLRHADLPTDITIPWWSNRRLHYEFARPRSRRSCVEIRVSADFRAGRSTPRLIGSAYRKWFLVRHSRVGPWVDPRIGWGRSGCRNTSACIVIKP